MKNHNTGPVQIAFPHVFTKRQPSKDRPDMKPKYEVTCLFPDRNDKKLLEMNDVAKVVIRESWPNTPPNLATPFAKMDDSIANRENEGKEPLAGWVRGGIAVALRSDNRPQIVNRSLEPVTQEDDLIYGGCICIVSYRCYSTKKGGRPRICFSLENIQYHSPGKRFVGGKNEASADFEPLDDDDVLTGEADYGDNDEEPAGYSSLLD